MLCAKFGGNWLSGSEEEEFFSFANVFSLFHNYLPWEKSRALHLDKLESPLSMDALSQVWLKYWLSGSGEEDSFNFIKCVFPI